MIIGRLTRDPESRTTPNGQNVVSFSVATNFQWTDQAGAKQKKVEYHNIVAWRKLAEICAQYLRKGSQVYLEGRLQTHDWEGQDGVKRSRTEIIADNMIMLGSKAASSDNSSFVREASSGEGSKAAEGKPVAEGVQSAPANKEAEINIEDIPF